GLSGSGVLATDSDIELKKTLVVFEAAARTIVHGEPDTAVQRSHHQRARGLLGRDKIIPTFGIGSRDYTISRRPIASGSSPQSRFPADRSLHVKDSRRSPSPIRNAGAPFQVGREVDMILTFPLALNHGLLRSA